MSGFTISKGFGLVTALAVSGTALFLAYGYKNRTYLNIRRGKGSLKNVHHVSGPLGKDCGISVEMLKGKENGKGGIHLPRMSLRPPKPSHSFVPTHEPTREEKLIKEKLVKSPDAELISCLHEEVRSSFRAADQLVEQLEKVSDISSLKSADSPDTMENRNKGAENLSGESTPVHGGRMEDIETKTGFDLPESSGPQSCQEEQTSKSVSVTPAPPKFAIVGCLIRPGNGANGKVGGRPKKQVRFSPSVIEPSSNNDEYRRRVGQQRGGARTPAQEQPAEAVRTTTPLRSRIYSFGAKQTVTYSIGCFDYRYSSRAYHPDIYEEFDKTMIPRCGTGCELVTVNRLE